MSKKKTAASGQRPSTMDPQVAAEAAEILREERGLLTDELIEIAARDTVRSPETQKRLEEERSRRGAFYSDLVYSLCNVRYEEHEARLLWVNLLAHKTEMSDRLGRNVGVRVAALDYFKNIVGLLDDVKIVGGADYIETELLAVTDGLTGLFNHRYLQDRLERAISRAAELSAPLALLMIDIDYFKQYNDLNGHIAGDVALRELATILRRWVKRDDVVARYGGEEFAVMLTGAEKEAAARVAERLRTEVEATDFPGEQVLPGGQLTISLGVAAFPADASERAGLIASADEALYAAKRGGRNRVCLGPDEGSRAGVAGLRFLWRRLGPGEVRLRPATLAAISARGAVVVAEEMAGAGAGEAVWVALSGAAFGSSLEFQARVAWTQRTQAGGTVAELNFEPDRPEVQAELEAMFSRRTGGGRSSDGGG